MIHIRKIRFSHKLANCRETNLEIQGWQVKFSWYENIGVNSRIPEFCNPDIKMSPEINQESQIEQLLSYDDGSNIYLLISERTSKVPASAEGGVQEDRKLFELSHIQSGEWVSNFINSTHG